MPIIKIMCEDCNSICDVLVIDDKAECSICGSVNITKLVSIPSSFNFNCEIQSESKGKPTSSHPKGTNFLFGKEKDRVKKEKKAMNKALDNKELFLTGKRKEKER